VTLTLGFTGGINFSQADSNFSFFTGEIHFSTGQNIFSQIFQTIICPLSSSVSFQGVMTTKFVPLIALLSNNNNVVVTLRG